ncbi:methyltransferase domain-containing protein [Candidatus Pacearchaeota archaeon]|nr:methyltransferase domain-containing protein [Candidatus Pacearchaeota archaeon]
MASLDIGCGSSKHPSSVGLDSNGSLEGVDVVHEIKRGRCLPFKDDAFDEIYLTDIIEHVEDIPWLLSEVHRVSRNGAAVNIRYPHYSGINAYGDVTHRHFLSLGAFDHFDPDTESGKRYQYYRMFERNFPFTIKGIEPAFRRGGLRWLVYNCMGGAKNEARLSRIFPIENVNLVMRVRKD